MVCKYSWIWLLVFHISSLSFILCVSFPSWYGPLNKPCLFIFHYRFSGPLSFLPKQFLEKSEVHPVLMNSFLQLNLPGMVLINSFLLCLLCLPFFICLFLQHFTLLFLQISVALTNFIFLLTMLVAWAKAFSLLLVWLKIMY